MKKNEFLFSGTNFKLSESICYILVQDCYKYDFVKNNEPNISGFLNVIIPKLSKKREEQHRRILKHNNYDKNLTRIVEENIYNIYLKDFDLEEENKETISFRINNKYRDDFIYIYDNVLDLFDMNFTNYIRSLLKEYSLMKELKRELCYFYNELDEINDAILEHQKIKVYSDKVYEMIPIALEQCYQRDINYLVGIDLDFINVHIIPLSSIKRISYMSNCYNVNNEILEKVAMVTYSYLYEGDED